MKINKILRINIFSAIFFIIFYSSIKWILKLNNLAFRNFIDHSLKFIIILLVLSVLIQMILLIYKYMKSNKLKTYHKIISIFSISIICFFIFGLLFYSSIYAIFSYSPEYIIEKNNIKFVAHVDSFLEVNVHYYEYVNPILRGYSKIFTEDYGDGGYDPFQMESMPDIENTIYY